jgi:hypothetical protein
MSSELGSDSGNKQSQSGSSASAQMVDAFIVDDIIPESKGTKQQ